MKDEAVILLAQFEDYSWHKLAKYIAGNLKLGTVINMNYYQPLLETFSRAIAYDYAKRMTEIGVKGMNEEIIELVRRERPRYVIWLRNMYEFLESTFASVRSEGSKIIGLFVDDEYRFAYYSKWWTPYVDYVVTFDFEALPKYQALGARVIHVLPCEGTPVALDWSNIEEKYEVSFVGGKGKSCRENYVNELKKRNIPVSLFGKGWEGGYVSTNDMIDIFTTSKINLNFSGTDHRTGLKGRMTFILLAGGFLLTEYTPGLEKYFQLGKEIICFKNSKEMTDKINYYLSHDEERRAIARAGWERAVKEYTPFHMFSRIFDEIEKDAGVGDKKNEPEVLKMPLLVRTGPSQYYFQWGRGFMEEGYDGLWKDALEKAVSYNPFNLSARYYNFIGSLPLFSRPVFFKLYLLCQAAVKLWRKLLLKLLDWSDYLPLLGDLKQSVLRRLNYI